jgi:hypothetical protein
VRRGIREGCDVNDDVAHVRRAREARAPKLERLRQIRLSRAVTRPVTHWQRRDYLGKLPTREELSS